MWTALLTSNPAVQTATEGDTSLTFWGKRQFEQPRRCQPWVERKNLGNLVDRKWRENAEKGIPERGGGEEGGGKERFFVAFPRGAAGVPVTRWGSSIWSLESRISQAYPSQISHPYPVPTLRAKNGASCERHRWQLSACQRREKRSDTRLSPWASSSLHIFSLVPVTSFYSRKLLFLANLSVSYKIKLLREWTQLRN